MVTADVRRLLIDEIDARDASCVLVVAELVDAPPHVLASREDILTVVTAATGSGDVPIGPIAYTPDEIAYRLDADAAVASMSTRGPDDEVTLRLALALGAGGSVGVAGSRYGHLPHLAEKQTAAAVFLPDLEASIAELVVYVRERAAVLGYTGRVGGTFELLAPGPIEAYVVDPDTGRATHTGQIATIEAVPFAYRIDAGPQEVDAVVYDVAVEFARRFGAAEPQFLLPG